MYYMIFTDLLFIYFELQTENLTFRKAGRAMSRHLEKQLCDGALARYCKFTFLNNHVLGH